MTPPFLTHWDKRRQHLYKTVRYNATGQKLDIWRPKHLNGPAPVLMFIPGGAWVIGHRVGQGHALMSNLVERGWICVAIDYRTAPKHRWPASFIDARDALAWVRANVSDYGGDPNFIAVAGASAGGHLASLLGLVRPPEVPPAAVVSLYAPYDWQFRSSMYHEGLLRYLEKVVVGKRQGEYPEIYRDGSPVARVHPGSPPFCIIHGANDWVVPVGGARRFHKKLAAVSEAPVVYYEIPGAGHAFDLVNAGQTADAVEVIDEFLDSARRSTLKEAS